MDRSSPILEPPVIYRSERKLVIEGEGHKSPFNRLTCSLTVLIRQEQQQNDGVCVGLYILRTLSSLLEKEKIEDRVE